jgi:hypothetical protein
MRIDASNLIWDKPTGEMDGFPLRLQKSQLTGKEFHYSPLLQAGFLNAVPDPGGIIDYSKQCPSVDDQQNRGACFAFSGEQLLSYIAKAMGIYPTQGLSKAYLYSKCKQYDGSPDAEGSDNKTLARMMRTFGTCLESTLPYSKLLELPEPKFPATTETMDKEAQKFAITKTAFVLSTIDLNRDNAEYLIRQALLQFGPQVIGFYVFSSFIPDSQGIIPIPGSVPGQADYFRGCHDTLLVGHDPEKGLKFLNSWGTNWGDGGYGFLKPGWEKAYWEPAGSGLGKSWFLMESLTALDDGQPTPKPDLVTVPRADLIVFTLDSDTMYVDGRAVRLEQPAEADPDTNRSLAPIAKFADAAGYAVQWIEKDRQIILRNRG